MGDPISAALKKLVDRFKPNLRTSETLEPIELQCFANMEALLVSFGEGMNEVVEEVEEFMGVEDLEEGERSMI